MKVFKYYPPEAFDYIFKEKSISLRFSQTDLLNDPFEQKIARDIDIKTIQSIENEVLKETGYNLNQEERETICKKIKESLEQHSENDFGILSLTQNEKNRAMWAHYSKSHSGFMIEIDLDGLRPYVYSEEMKKNKNTASFSGLVKYRKKRPKVKFGKRINIISYLNKLCFTKDYIWKYENEYRVVYPFKNLDILGVDSNGVTIFGSLLNEEYLCKIVLGIKASEALEKRIIHWLNNNTKNTTLHRAFPCEETFEFYYKEVDLRHTSDTPST
ncbi:DUF2971 domain-containing protein [Marinomonas sp.]|uniref:DUF2971 domain-containing protein n=1 Tax=Marinomonas sp. TaxID=1904862 RepID=UPI003A9383FB